MHKCFDFQRQSNSQKKKNMDRQKQLGTPMPVWHFNLTDRQHLCITWIYGQGLLQQAGSQSVLLWGQKATMKPCEITENAKCTGFTFKIHETRDWNKWSILLKHKERITKQRKQQICEKETVICCKSSIWSSNTAQSIIINITIKTTQTQQTSVLQCSLCWP